MPAPRYQLAFCQGYEKETGKYYDYGTVVPMIYGEKEHLMNLLEFFRAYPDKKADIDQYLNYCQMFYDYTNIFETDFFQEHTRLAEELATHVLVSILKGDQNYHYENVAFVCDSSNRILRIAPMIDHEFSTYFMFPDATGRHLYWFGQLQRSIAGAPVAPEEFAFLSNPEERSLMEKSATCLHKNLLYIKEHFPRAVQDFTSRSALLEQAITKPLRISSSIKVQAIRISPILMGILLARHGTRTRMSTRHSFWKPDMPIPESPLNLTW